MRRATTPQQKGLERRLRAARVARLATVDARGRPHLVPICFVYDRGVFYTAIDRKPKRTGRLRRLQNIEANPQVALLVDHYEEDWDRLWYVLVRGRATLLGAAERKEAEKARGLLRKKYANYRTGLLPPDAPVICIRPQRITSWGRS